MKMNSLLRVRQSNTRKKTNLKARVIGVIVLAVAVVFMSTSVLRGALFYVVSPLWAGQNFIAQGIQHSLALFSSKNALIKENNDLHVANNRADLRLSSLSILEQENAELKTRLGRPQVAANSILAAVLVKPGRAAYDTLIIDIGSLDGLKGEEMVLADGVIAIGKVKEVYSTSAKVVLFSSSGEITNVYVGDKAISTEASGLGGGNFEASLPNEIEVSIGDTISLPGGYPVVFGTVEAVSSRPTDPSQMIRFRLPVNMSELRYVDVVPNRAS
jgi:cell shape-determining protein MreC